MFELVPASRRSSYRFESAVKEADCSGQLGVLLVHPEHRGNLAYIANFPGEPIGDYRVKSYCTAR